MRPLPLRWRVASWSAISTGVALVAFAAGTLINLYQEQIEEVDLELGGVAHRIADIGDDAGAGGASIGVREAEYEPWLAAAVFAADGRLLVDSDRMPESIARAAQGHDRPTTLRAPEGEWRVLTLQGNEQTLILAYDLQEVHEIVTDLLTGYVIALPIAAGFAALGGWVVAGRALRPLRTATEAAARITPDKLEHRLPVPLVEDEIAVLTRVINAMLDRMESSFRQAERFAADASHEILTPLTIIKGEIEAALRMPDLAEAVQTRLLSMQEEIARLHRVVDQLLLLARLDSGAEHVHRNPVDLTQLIRAACEDIEPLASAHGVRLDASIDEHVWVSGDEDQLRRVLLNLLDNAAKFNERGGTIICSLRCERERVLMSVTNTGPAIPSELHARLFERFFRGDSSRVRAGHGLGLSLSREIIQAHNGALELVRSDSETTEFRVMLPARGV